MIKIAILKSRLCHKGGLEKYTVRLAKAFSESGCKVTLLTTGDSLPIENVEIVSLGKSLKFSLAHLYFFDKHCKKWLSKHPQDVIFGMERNSFQTHYRAGSGVHAAYLKRRAFTDTNFKRLFFHLNPLHRYILQLEKKAFENPHLRCLFTNSEMVKKEILEYYRTSENLISVVHNGVEWQEWQEHFQKSFPRKQKKPFQFLFVGHGFRRKGLLFLLRGLSLLKAHDFELTIVGKDKETDFFINETKKLNLKKRVHFVGPQSELPSYYQAADALVIPSVYDPFANVTVEALAMGLFVVSSRYNGGCEVLTPQSGTIIEDLTSPESVARSLEKALNTPKTEDNALLIRSSIKELDFSIQLDKIVRQTCVI